MKSVSSTTKVLQSYLNPYQVSFLILYVTNRCNFRCNFCFYGKEIEKGIKPDELTLDDKFIVSENAWRLSQSGYSSMFIMIGDEISVENLLKGIIISSGNDACVALAEGIAGSEEEFAILMNEKAEKIGMTNSNFSNKLTAGQG